MKISNASCKGITKVLRILTIVSFLAGLLLSCAAPPDGTKTQVTGPTTTPTPQRSEEARQQEDWRISMAQVPVPKKGCFNASYPKKEWEEVACVKAPNIPAPPRQGPRPLVVGAGDDISAQAPSGHITQAIGHFENVSNVTSESGPIGNTGPSIANAYTLQINTDFFTGSTACGGSPNPGCTGWEQWVYWNTGPGAGSASMQYWLVSYNANCPAGQGWNQVPVLGTSCWKNSNNAVSVPSQPITNMANWTFTGTATSTGDSVTMSTGTNVYTTSGDNVVAASTAWTIAEFNIFGAGGDSSGGGGMATFNAGASANTRTQIVYGGNGPPNCVVAGFTAETNSLSFAPTAPGGSPPGPAVIFTENTAGVNPADCMYATTVGDTHLHTFGGLHYDFQASGDFVLAQVDKDFVVQTRQVSGAPTWPDASVNSAVATRMGGSSVAVCLPGRLNVDGENKEMGDGTSLSTPGGVDIWRKGNIYYILGPKGDSVRATVNPSYIDVSVGLGHWPANVTGLLANVEGNVNKIAARDGTVLTNPFNFGDLYNRFGESWRVQRGESLLAACGDKAVETGNPKRPFFAKDLEPKVYERTRAVCVTAGVKEGPLLDACTLDVAVIGNDAAAKGFLGAREPLAVGNIVATSGELGTVFSRWWWLILIGLVLVAFILWIVLKKKKTSP